MTNQKKFIAKKRNKVGKKFRQLLMILSHGLYSVENINAPANHTQWK